MERSTTKLEDLDFADNIAILQPANYCNMFHEIQGCLLLDDVISHVTLSNFFILLISCLVGRIRIPNCSSTNCQKSSK